jgi:hypothetical protein
LRFKDQTSAFFKRHQPQIDNTGKDITSRRNRELVLSECGASVLSDLLGLDVVMRSEMVNLPKLSPGHPFAALSGLGVLSEWVENLPYAQAPDEIKQKALQDRERLFQLYIYLAIARDQDQHDENIVISQPDHQLWSIDHEKSGGCSDSALNPLTPLEIFDPILNQPLPRKLTKKLQQFIANQPENESLLRAYYSPQQVHEIFQRAQYLATFPVAQPILEFYENALYHEP